MATANPSISESAIEQITAGRGPHHEPFGWHHWPEYRRSILGSPTNFAGRSVRPRKGGGSVSEVMQAGSRMIPGDLESWHAEWTRIADRNWARGLAEEKSGHVRTAMNCFLRAADYYRQAEFHLEPDDQGARGLRRSASSIGFSVDQCLDSIDAMTPYHDPDPALSVAVIPGYGEAHSRTIVAMAAQQRVQSGATGQAAGRPKGR